MIVHNYDIDNSINSSLSEFETSYHIPFIIDNFLQWWYIEKQDLLQ